MAGVVHSYLGAKIKDRIKGRKDGKGIEEEEKNKKNQFPETSVSGSLCLPCWEGNTLSPAPGE